MDTIWLLKSSWDRLWSRYGEHVSLTFCRRKMLTIDFYRDQGYLIVGSGMAVHSFPSIGEVFQAPKGPEQDAVRAKNLKEANDFEDQIRAALSHASVQERHQALLDLEKLPDFKRSHPTVEVGQH